MKPYNKSIELFGISATGKSYIRQKIIKKLSKNGYEIYGTREIIIRHIDEFINLNIYQKIKIFYFRILLFLNIKTSLWNSDLNKICNKFSKKYKKKFKKFEKLKSYIFINNDIPQVKHYDIWFNELLIANLLFEKISKIHKNKIFFPDEGFAQKIFILAYITNNFNKKKIHKYLQIIYRNRTLINVSSFFKEINKRMLKRKKTNIGWIATKDQLLNMKKVEKIINKNRNQINIFYIKNNNNINLQIIKILNEIGLNK